MSMKLLFSTIAVLAGLVVTVSAQQVTVLSWGGSYTKSQVEAYHKPFTESTGITVKSVDAANPASPLKAQVEAGNVSVDVADVTRADAIRLCDEGLIEQIDVSILPPAPDGTPAEEDFIDGGILDCGVANVLWSTVVAYNSKLVPRKPTSIKDFFDLKNFPGKRGLSKGASANLEMALMGDGVPADEVYDILETRAGIKRAFAKLDSIKDSIVWWEAGAQPPQLLADGEVVMSTAYNGRIFDAAAAEGQPLEVLWDGQILEFSLFVIPRGAPNKEIALEFITFATNTQSLADQASWISYGPARKSSNKEVGLYKDGKTRMAPHMPTAAKNLENALVSNYEFWVDRNTDLTERFNSWLSN